MKLGLHDIRYFRQIADPDGFEDEIWIFKTKRFHKSGHRRILGLNRLLRLMIDIEQMAGGCRFPFHQGLGEMEY